MGSGKRHSRTIVAESPNDAIDDMVAPYTKPYLRASVSQRQQYWVNKAQAKPIKGGKVINQ